MNRIGLTVAFVVTAAGAALLLVYKQRFEAEVEGGVKVPVLIALADLAPGTRIAREHLGVRELPEKFVEGRHVRGHEANALVGVRLANALRANETVLWTDVATSAMQSRQLSNLVPKGMRALSLSVGDSSFGGLLNPGDRVDALLTVDGPGKTRQTRVVAQNLLVLAVGDDLGYEVEARGTRGNPRQTVVSLAVSVRDGQRLALAAREGMVSLLLRNAEDLRTLDDLGEATSRELGDTGLGVRATTASAGGAPPAPLAAPDARSLIEAAVRAGEGDDPEARAALERALATLGLEPVNSESDQANPGARGKQRRPPAPAGRRLEER